MKLGILGSGFGLYGYAVAGKRCSYEILTLERYKDIINKRFDLSSELMNVKFVESEKNLIVNSDVLVIALNPESQVRILSEYNFSNKRLFLEKPLAFSLHSHQTMIELLEKSSLDFSIGYLFEFTAWGEQLLSDHKKYSIEELVVEWRIPRPKSDWKSDNLKGGGIVKFYGIHFLHYLLGINYKLSDLIFSQSIAKVKFSDQNIEISIEVIDNNQNSKFCINWKSGNNLRKYELETPFGRKPHEGAIDPRVGYLIKYITSTNNVRENLRREKSLIDYFAQIKSKLN